MRLGPADEVERLQAEKAKVRCGCSGKCRDEDGLPRWSLCPTKKWLDEKFDPLILEARKRRIIRD